MKAVNKKMKKDEEKEEEWEEIYVARCELIDLASSNTISM